VDALKENVAYLQGLVEGLDIDTASKEGRIIRDIVDALGDVADAVDQLNSRQSELENYLDSIDGELLELEDSLYGNGDYVEVECPECEEVVCFDAGILDDEDLVEVTCPNCDTVVFVNDGEYDTDFEDEENEDDDEKD